MCIPISESRYESQRNNFDQLSESFSSISSSAAGFIFWLFKYLSPILHNYFDILVVVIFSKLSFLQKVVPLTTSVTKVCFNFFLVVILKALKTQEKLKKVN